MPSDSEHSQGWESLDEDDHRNFAEQHTEIRVKMENHSDKEITPIKREYASDSTCDEEDDPCEIANHSINNNNAKTKKKNDSSTCSPSALAKSQSNELILNNYLSANTDLNRVSCDSIADIDEDEDIWLVQCPQTLNLSTLRDVDLLQKRKKIKLNGKVFECISVDDDNERVNTISLISSQVSGSENFKTMHQCKVNGVFLLREKLMSSYDVEVSYDPIEKIPFPTGLKKRHPLFGVHYKNQLKLPSSVIEKLNNPTEKKKNIEKKPAVKFTKKRKNKDIAITPENMPCKKIKREPTDVWMSEISIEKELFELPIKSVKKEKRLN